MRGRFEARIELPGGNSLWPAFWMPGADIDTSGATKCGEIDGIENIGREPSINHGSWRAPGSDDFHLYALEGDPGTIRFYVGGHRRRDADGGTWPFDHPFFFLLNLAVAGEWPGDPDHATTFPQPMQVDWLRADAKN